MELKPEERSFHDAAQTADWSQFNGVDAAKAMLSQAAVEIDDLIAQAFLTEAGKACLEHLKKRIVDPPSWRIGDALEHAHFREGQKSVVLQIAQSVNNAAARRAAAQTRQPEPQTRQE
jgi:hypothetical protein